MSQVQLLMTVNCSMCRYVCAWKSYVNCDWWKEYGSSYEHYSTVSRHSPEVLTWRVFITIICFFIWLSFPLFSWPSWLIQGWYHKEKLDANHSEELKVSRNYWDYAWILQREFNIWRFKVLSFLVSHCLIFLGYLCIALKQKP